MRKERNIRIEGEELTQHRVSYCSGAKYNIEIIDKVKLSILNYKIKL